MKHSFNTIMSCLSTFHTNKWELKQTNNYATNKQTKTKNAQQYLNNKDFTKQRKKNEHKLPVLFTLIVKLIIFLFETSKFVDI